MSDEIKDAPAKPLNTLTKDTLRRQVETLTKHVSNVRAGIKALEDEIQQNIGIIKYSEHLLAQFDLPEKVEEKKPEPPSLEVK